MIKLSDALARLNERRGNLEFSSFCGGLGVESRFVGFGCLWSGSCSARPLVQMSPMQSSLGLHAEALVVCEAPSLPIGVSLDGV